MELKKIDSSKILLDINSVTRIKHSEEAKNQNLYGNLYNQILKYKKVRARDLRDFDSKAVSAITNKQIQNNLLYKIKCEWIVDDREDRVENQIHCQLCNQPNNRIYYIRNLLNGNRLNVGSTCVEEFINQDDFTSVNKKFDELQEQQNKEQRMVNFGQIEIEDPDFINNAYKKLTEIDILLPDYLNNNIEQILYEIRNLKADFINRDGDLGKITLQYHTLKNRYYNLWCRAEIFYEENKSNKLSCNKEVSDWLKANHFDIWIKVSKNNGQFDRDTLKYAFHPTYIKNNINTIARCIGNPFLRIKNISTQSIKFIYKNDLYKKPLTLYLSNELFMKYIGFKCLTKSNYIFTTDDLKNIVKIDVSLSSVDTIYRRIQKLMKKAALELEIENITNSLYIKRIPVLHNNTNNKSDDTVCRYLEISVTDFCKMLNTIIFDTDPIIYRKLLAWKETLKMDKWISYNEKKDKYKLSKELSYKKRKEFINYV